MADLLALLVCPSCRGRLTRSSAGFRCDSCAQEYRDRASGQPDLRLRGRKRVAIDFPLGESDLGEMAKVDWGPLQKCAGAAVDFSGVSVPNHLSRELLSHFPKASPGQRVLDLGCGTALHRAVCERAGFQYVGLDYDNPHAPLLGDAHALPFGDGTFDFLISIAVLEHIRYPAVMLAEAWRVLRPGSTLIGTVSFQEPFHEISYHHHSHVAVWSGLRQAGFEASHIAPGWDGLTAHVQMALLPGWPAFAVGLATAPLRLVHRIWWRFLGRIRPGWSELHRRQIAAGAFIFIARRNVSAA